VRIANLLTPFIFLFIVSLAIASENSNTLNEEIVNNFAYHLKYLERTVVLENGEYKTSLRPGNDIKNYLSVKIEKYGIFKPTLLPPFAIVILSVNFGGSGSFLEITALVNENGKIIQTNSIELGDRVIIKDLIFQPGFVSFRDRERDSIYLSLLTHKENDPSCCPTKQETLCFTLVRDENKEMKLLTCEEAEKKHPLPVVKKPALYLYPTKTRQIEIYLKPKGWLTKTIPYYNGIWLVRASPKGIIDNKYEYLFYEVALNSSLDLPNEGWVVKIKELNQWFDKTLSKLGLKEKEIKDFKDFWLKELKGYPYFKIKVLSEKFLNDNLAIRIKPNPDKMIRVILVFEGIKQEEQITEPIIKTPKRKGFTVVEWGGILINEEGKNSDIKPFIEVKIDSTYPLFLGHQKVYCAETGPLASLEFVINLLKGKALVSVFSEKNYVEDKIQDMKEETSVIEVDEKRFPGLGVRFFFRIQDGPPIEVKQGTFNLSTKTN